MMMNSGNKIEDILKYDDDRLGQFLSDEEAKLKNGEVLLETMMNLPFKNKEKLKEIFERITHHKTNINLINQEIVDRKSKEPKEPTEMDWGDLKVSTNAMNGGISYISPNTFASVDLYERKRINVEVLDINEERKYIDVLDDVFESLLDNYYLVSIDGGNYIPLERVIGIEEDSQLGKWYERMSINFDRELKLERILKNKKDKNE